MKKAFGMVAGLAIFLLTVAFSFADEGDKPKGSVPREEKNWEQPPCRGMMHPLMSRSLVETKDGGIVVMTGNRLMKFDKDLNFIKEVELPADRETIQKMKMRGMRDCPWHKKMMKEGGMREEGASTNHGSTDNPE